jgi:pentose-5-phosphate-3-epimerase
MHLTFVNDMGQPSEIEIDGQMELENVMALLEAEVRVLVMMISGVR